jgi:hypothetical protein
MKAHEIIEKINPSNLVYKASYYFNLDDITVRVSNHLPKFSNWQENNNNEKGIFIFTDEIAMTESQIEKYLENEFSDISFQYAIITDIENIGIINYLSNQL